MSSEKGALEGLRVIEAATMLAAPMCGMMLADHGADVIKIELPTHGDHARAFGHQKAGIPLFWKILARNKRSITLDLRTPRGRELLLRLIATADVFIENFRPGTLDKWDLSAETLRAAKRDLIIMRMSGFGQTGPLSSRAGFGTLAEAMSGFAYINGWPDRPPTLPSFGLADAIAGMAAAYGVLAALRHRDRTGEGQDVDIALYEPILTVLGSIIIDYDQLGIVQERNGNLIPFAAPRNAYEARDGRWIAISCSTQSTAVRLLDAIGKPELLNDGRFSDNQARVANAGALDEHIAAWAKARSYEEAIAILDDYGVTAGPIYNAADLYKDEHIRTRRSIVPVQDDDLGEIWMQAPIPRLTKTPGVVAFAGRTAAGHDNAAVFGELLGLTDAELEEFAKDGVVSSAHRTYFAGMSCDE